MPDRWLARLRDPSRFENEQLVALAEVAILWPDTG
jgi:hypothetical protein